MPLVDVRSPKVDILRLVRLGRLSSHKWRACNVSILPFKNPETFKVKTPLLGILFNCSLVRSVGENPFLCLGEGIQTMISTKVAKIVYKC